jgi:rhamnosyl/mannosyltransferase
VYQLVVSRDAGDFNTRVLVASRSRRFSDHDEDIQGVRVVQAGCWGRFLSSPIAPRYVHWLRRLDSDILHFHMPNPTAELAYLLARPPRGRVVVTYHSDIVRQRLTGALYRPLQRRFLEQVRVIMPTSRAYLNSSATLAEHRARCRVVPLGVRLDELDETDASRAFSSEIRQQAAGRCALVFIGLLRYYKGLPFLLRALAHLPAHSSCLFLAGTPPQGREHERRLLERMVGELGLGNRVFFLGALTDAQAVGLRRAGDIFCSPRICEAKPSA